MKPEQKTRAPARIWLQDEGSMDWDWTWCADKINDDDVAYVRADLAASSETRLREALEEVLRRTEGRILAPPGEDWVPALRHAARRALEQPHD